MDKETWKEMCLLNTETMKYKRLVYNTLVFIKKCANSGGRWYVSFSGGKDSTVLFDLVKYVADGTPAIHLDEEFKLPETEQYLSRCKFVKTIVARAYQTEWFQSHATTNEQSLDTTNSKMPIEAWAREHGYDSAFVGVRADESNDRKKMLRSRGKYFFAKTKRQWACYPLAWWKVEDIWGYIFKNGLDYNRAYDRLFEIGVEPRHQRVGPLAVDRVLGFGQLSILKKGWPEVYARFSERFQEAGNYV